MVHSGDITEEIRTEHNPKYSKKLNHPPTALTLGPS